MISRWLYAGGVAAMGVGVALVYAAVITRGVFIPGTYLILLGVIACAGGMIAEVIVRRDEDVVSPRRQERERDLR